jgi:hypothetical protein
MDIEREKMISSVTAVVVVITVSVYKKVVIIADYIL